MDYKNLFRLDGQTVLITGSYGHLGGEISKGVSALGATVILQGRNQQKLEALSREISNSDGKSEIACFDLTNEKNLSDFIEKHAQRKINVIINNAYQGGAGSLTTSDPQNFRDSYELSLVKAFQLTKGLLPSLKIGVSKDNNASIINISSMYAMVSPDPSIYDSEKNQNPPFYGAAKAALIQFSRYAAVDLAKHGIRVNALCPGPFPSEKVISEQSKFVEKLAQKVPLGRIGNNTEITGPAIFLATKASSFVTGASLPVDGGWTAW